MTQAPDGGGLVQGGDMGVGSHGRLVHLFWVHTEGCVDRLNVGRT